MIPPQYFITFKRFFMLALKQTKLLDRNKVGNCFATCVACILGLDIEDVPNVEVLFVVNGNFWLKVFDKWISSIGYNYTQIQENEWEENELYLANGMTERGTMHSVIYKNGNLFHDPHPSNSGLTEVKFYTAIRPF